MPRTAVVLLPILLAVSACATSSSDTYMPQDVGKVMETTRGTVVAAREVSIRGESTGLGPVIGGASTGIIAGTTIGAGDGSVIAGVIGGLLGMAMGYMAEEALRSGDGIEYVIETEDGRTVTIVQNDEDQAIAAGTPVMVQWGSEYSRVVPLQYGGRAGAPGGAPGAYAAPAGAAGAVPATYPASDPATYPASESPVPLTPGGAPAASSPPGGGGEWINPDTVPVGQQQPYDSGAAYGAQPYDPDPAIAPGATAY